MDERQEKKAYRATKKLEDLHKYERDQFMIAALGTPEGRSYFYWLLEICHIGHQPYNGNALDTAFRCGELNVGQLVQSHLISVSPDSFLKMLKEKEEERKANERLSKPANPNADPYASTGLDTGTGDASDSDADTSAG